MGLFDDITGAASSVGSGIADRAKAAAKEAKLDVTAFAGGANKVIGAPTVGTVKGAFSGNPGDIAKVGIAAATIIPVAKGASLLRGASEADRAASLISDAARAKSLVGTGQELAPWMQSAGKFSRLQQAPAGIGMRARGIIAGGEQGSLNISKFPDSTANIARRVKGRVMGAIAATGGDAELASKIAATKEEIVRLGGTPPTGPFAGVTASKLKSVQGELASLPAEGAASTAKAAALKILKGGESGALRIPGAKDVAAAHANVPVGQLLVTFNKDAASASQSSPGGRVVDKALFQRAANDVRSGRAKLAGFYEKLNNERGSLRLPGTRDINTGELKASVWRSVNEGASDVVMPDAKNATERAALLAGRSKFHKELMEFQKMVPALKMNAARLPKN